MVRRQQIFTTVRSEGAILPVDLLQRIAALDPDIKGTKPEDYHLDKKANIRETISSSWNRLIGAWATFKERSAELTESDPGTSVTRDRWLLPLFQELGYGRLQTAKAVEIEGKSYPISHAWGHLPIQLLGCNINIDKLTPKVAGAAKMNPHGLVQEFLNRSDNHLWAFLSNGRQLRILRDNISMTRQAYVEFDLQAMMEGEVYSDFVLLWLLCHQSRVEAERPEQCWLEKWSQTAKEQGTRALDTLRNGVQNAISQFGGGFLFQGGNQQLKERLRSGELTTQDYYRQLLRLVYRLLFLFVAEDRNLLLMPGTSDAARNIYNKYYSTTRIRSMAEHPRGTKHRDLWQQVKIVMMFLGDKGRPDLGLPALGSYLWSDNAMPDLLACEITNRDLLKAINALAYTVEKNVTRPVDYKNLGSEELGSIYESLLEMHPEINTDSGYFMLTTAPGHERKTTGSYYTPSSLVNCLLDSALDPVLNEAAKKSNPEQAILDLKICDPACGSGHFLIAAAHRIAHKLASIRSGDTEPSPEDVRTALRNVVGRCLYGVDINPMAVELCKVSLWMEALEPGKPMSFLESRILCGNSLLGTTPRLMNEGIPDDAFKPIEGDDKAVCSEYRKRNKEERTKGTRYLFGPEPIIKLGNLPATLTAIDDIDDSSVDGIRRKQEQYERFVKSSDYIYAELLADAWCASFVWKKTRDGTTPITETEFRHIEETPHSLSKQRREEIGRLAKQYQFFHWHLAFPGVFRMPVEGEDAENEQTGWSGGFDVVLGNPPWETLEFREREWFIWKENEIATAGNTSIRSALILHLARTNKSLFDDYQRAKRQLEAEVHLIRNGNRLPLTSVGKINTYAAFTETGTNLLAQHGMLGFIVPTGIATDAHTSTFFGSLVKAGRISSLFDFENRQRLFISVAPVQKFCLITIGGSNAHFDNPTYAFWLADPSDCGNPRFRINMNADDIKRINPQTCTLPVFRSCNDARISKTLYCDAIMLKSSDWSIFFRQMLNSSSDSDYFRREASGINLPVALYEPKYFKHFDHRYGSYEGIPNSLRYRPRAGTHSVTPEQKCNEYYEIEPRYWIEANVRDERWPDSWNFKWIIAFRKLVRPSTDSRCLCMTALPFVGITDTAPLCIPLSAHAKEAASFMAMMNAFVVDYCVFQKLGGTALSNFIVEQLPVLPRQQFGQNAGWDDHIILFDFFAHRVLELCFTSYSLINFARDMGYDGPPFKWDEERRFLLRCELDAAFFHLYGIVRDDVDYIMDTFPIVKRKDEKLHGFYRTKDTILMIYDMMRQSMDTGKPYETVLDPPAADPRVAHPPRKVK